MVWIPFFRNLRIPLGSTPQRVRQQYIDEFNRGNEVDVFILSTKVKKKIYELWN
jgi:SNF2 family DNA or RNA helicase